jgi:hypothetical protein
MFSLLKKISDCSEQMRYVTLQHKTSRLGQILESEILDLCDSVLARAFHQYIRYYNTIIFDRDKAI